MARADKSKTRKGRSKKAKLEPRSKKKAHSRRSPRPWLRRLLLSSLLAIGAATLACSFVFLALYRQALDQVTARLEADLWDLPGQVLSGPIDVWPGLRLSPESLAKDLQGAGYARVDKASQPGDFQVGADSMLVINRAASGPGWRVPAGQVLLTFKGDSVASVSPSRLAMFPPTALAGIRGADNEARTPRSLNDFPEHLKHAVLAMEDARFYEHQGVSVVGITRAIVVNLVSGKARQGGSTLTQQLAKNLFLTQERTLSRKGHELLLAFALERQLSKDEILSLYLNEIYWGQAGGVAMCGADEASKAYFGKPVDRLSLGESATLAGIISSPNSYSPLRHPERAKERRDLALQRMVDEFWLEQDQADAAKALPLAVQPGVTGRRAPYAVDTVVDMVEAALGQGAIAAQGLSVQSTIHPPLQRLAEEVLAESMAKLEAAYPKATGVQAALVAVRVSDGAIVAMVGGRDYGESQFNRAMLAQRQIGSTVKPLTMLAAFDADPALSPGTMLLDEPIERRVNGKTWRPANYDGQYVGDIPLRQAISHSRNVPAVLLAERLGFGKLQAALKGLGLLGATKLPSVSLGGFEGTPVQLAGAYTVFPGGGVYAPPQLLRAVQDADGVVLLSREPAPSRQASAKAAYMATSVLQTVMESGTGARAKRFGATGALGGKTGTTDGYRDAWFVGFTPTLSVAVWVGFDSGGSAGLAGSKAALPTWSRFVAGSGTSAGSYAMPAGLDWADTCMEWAQDELLGRTCLECVPELYRHGYAPVFGCSEGLIQGGLQQLLDGVRGRPREPVQSPDGERTPPSRWPWKWRR